MNSGDSNGCTTIQIYLLAMNCIFKNSENGKFYMYFTKIKNWKTQIKDLNIIVIAKKLL